MFSKAIKFFWNRTKKYNSLSTFLSVCQPCSTMKYHCQVLSMSQRQPPYLYQFTIWSLDIFEISLQGGGVDGSPGMGSCHGTPVGRTQLSPFEVRAASFPKHTFGTHLHTQTQTFVAIFHCPLHSPLPLLRNLTFKDLKCVICSNLLILDPSSLEMIVGIAKGHGQKA